MNKIWLIGIGAVLIAGLITLAFWLTGSSTPASTTNTQTGQNILPVANSVGNSNVTTLATTSTSVSGTTLSVTAVGGGTIQVTNFIKDPATAKDPINSGYYYLGYHTYEGVPDSTVTENPPYVIAYIDATQYFNIVLLQEPIGSVREEAEQYLMTHLGISQSQMCRLNYTLGVPARVNSQFAGINLGFSFCPGATTLPK